ncbi:MAG TPA: sensor domain-containing diguanylate cyclase [Myxococcales bacterium]|nr:sensor domain-containing diguanylate cyclase [Myxococcales bacterium]
MNAGDLLAALKRTVGQLAAFNDIAKALTSSLELSEVLNVVMAKVSELLSPRNWSLLLWDDATDKLYFEVVVGKGAERLRSMQIEAGEGIAGSVFTTGKARRVDDVRADPAFSVRFDHASEFETRSVLAVPLRVRGHSLGVIELVNGPADPSFTEDDLQALSAIAEFAAIAIDNARNFRKVQELTLTDEHTGLYNVRHLRALLEKEVARAQRFQHPLSVIFLDLDHFKQVNDTHGHLVGSALLEDVARLLAGSIRQVDSAFRYGGDEFVILLIETDTNAAQLIAGRIREAFHRRSFLADRGLEIRIAASFGVATYPDQATSATALLAASDAAMYEAKAAGRDAIRSAPFLAAASPALPPEP